ncbi:uncharacterized protein LOC115927870 [Strongylocentrotus purpuratus]|uniref:TIR domain-containing protein n=1 Tax=Strongylocentrotus purpuratus TaxID=7668 RepID=A0A7M7T2Y0_STRPU|nr:uncharacterized protein LOC115927870 [Strongylocentrotus purpuratus]
MANGSMWFPFLVACILVSSSFQSLHRDDGDSAVPFLTLDMEKHFHGCDQNLELKIASCHDKGLDTVPQNLSEDTEVLDLSQNNVTKLLNSSFEVYPLINSLDVSSNDKLSLKGNNIQHIHDDVLSGLGQIISINFEGNRIAYLEELMFSNNWKLTNLSLADNRLTRLNQSTFKPIYSSILSLDLSMNPINCNCDLKWLIDWLNKPISLLEKENTICSSASLEPLREKPLLNFDPNKLCMMNNGLFSLIPLASISLVVISVLLYHYRWQLRYKLFLFKLAVLGYKEMRDARDHNDYEFDVNIIFYDDDEDDEEWIREHLRPALEERLPQFHRNVFGDEDLVLGMHYLDSVDYVVSHSYKTIIVLSRAAVHDHWFILKFRTAMDHVSDTLTEFVVVLFLEDIPDDEMPFLARLYLSDGRPYIHWTENVRGQQYFWDELIKNLTINLRTNDLIPNELNHERYKLRSDVEALYAKPDMNRKTMKSISRSVTLECGRLEMTTPDLDYDDVRNPMDSVIESAINYELKKASCRDKGLDTVPKNLSEDTKMLDLSQNNISKLLNSSFEVYPLITSLDISDNDVRAIESAAFYPLKALRSLYLVFSPRLVLPSTGVFMMSSQLSILDFILVVISVLLYRYRWQLRYKVFLFKLAVLGYKEMRDARDHNDYEFDVNIIFYDDDEEWIREQLRPALEERLPQFQRNVFGDEYVVLGMHYLDSVDYVVSHSHKTIIVLSRAAVHDHWFILKFRTAMDHVSDTLTEFVVVVFLEDIPDDEMPFLARLYLSDGRPYIHWNENVRGQEYFWDKLTKNLTINLRTNDLIPSE